MINFFAVSFASFVEFGDSVVEAKVYFDKIELVTRLKINYNLKPLFAATFWAIFCSLKDFVSKYAFFWFYMILK